MRRYIRVVYHRRSLPNNAQNAFVGVSLTSFVLWDHIDLSSTHKCHKQSVKYQSLDNVLVEMDSFPDQSPFDLFSNHCQRIEARTSGVGRLSAVSLTDMICDNNVAR
jgi:hypothetical protein